MVIHNEQEPSSHDELAMTPEAGFFSWDIASGTVYADSAFAELYGLDPAKTCRGLPIDDYLDRIVDEDRQRLTETIVRCIEGDYPQQEIYRVTNARGERTSVLSYGRVFMNTDGVPTQYVGIVVPSAGA